MRSHLMLLILMLYPVVAQTQPQTFSSGSTGSDGALTYAPNLGTVYFPPSGLAPRANNIYNFTTVSIGTGTTVRISGWVINGPVYWLAQGDVTINGTLDISGQPGQNSPVNPSFRAPSEPGPGGYSGGVAQLGSGQSATAGSGLGGGAAASSTAFGGGGLYKGSSYLLPLVGGSGGGGGCSPTHIQIDCADGGAGGGAILIASSTKIILGGVLDARGGAGGNGTGGGGSGGAVRLVSNTITNNGTVVVGGGLAGGDNGSQAGGSGIVRFEGFAVNTGAVNGTTALTSTPYSLALPIGGPSNVSITSVNNIAVNANPFSFPDTTISTGTAVPVIISGVNVPSGTSGNLYIFSETAPDQVIPFTLTGSLQSTTATVNVSYPSGGSRGFAKVIW